MTAQPTAERQKSAQQGTAGAASARTAEAATRGEQAGRVEAQWNKRQRGWAMTTLGWCTKTQTQQRCTTQTQHPMSETAARDEVQLQGEDGWTGEQQSAHGCQRR